MACVRLFERGFESSSLDTEWMKNVFFIHFITVVTTAITITIAIIMIVAKMIAAVFTAFDTILR